MYKCTLAFIALFFFNAVQAQKIQWMSMNEALEAQEREPKKIFMDAYTTWCGPCKMLDRNTFTNKDVVRYINENYYPVKFNAEGTEEVVYQDTKFKNPSYDAERKGRNSQHQFAAAIGVRGYPSLVFFDEKGTLLGPVMGYRTPQQLEVFLKFFAEDKHETVSTREDWQEYEENFEPSFGK